MAFRVHKYLSSLSSSTSSKKGKKIMNHHLLVTNTFLSQSLPHLYSFSQNEKFAGKEDWYWRTLFNLHDKNLRLSKKQKFAYSIRTDGVQCSVGLTGKEQKAKLTR
mmetsp:Transcript_43357/g.60858  ORF Transcript_43357/g.60858 Transcript_43357/m.60858 type:complete len:106 (-) Transcript_43357:159-476(-)